MLEYDNIDASEGIDVNKTNALKVCDVCHCYCFCYRKWFQNSFLVQGQRWCYKHIKKFWFNKIEWIIINIFKYIKKWVLVIKEIKKDYLSKQNNTMKITKKDCKSKQDINIENYSTSKKI